MAASNSRLSERGFTLMEVLVALAIIAIAMAAAIKAVSENTANAGYLRDKTFAQWVASNKWAELDASPTWVNGRQNGTTEMGGRRWPWRWEVQPTPNENIRRVEISVFSPDDDEAQMAQITGFLVNPELRSAGGSSGTPSGLSGSGGGGGLGQ